MTIKDARGKKIEIGSYIRYTGTGTMGIVIDIKKDNEEDWLKLEKPDLWYSSESVEVVDKKSIKNFNDKHRGETNINSIKDLNDEFEDISLASGGAEGGG